MYVANHPFNLSFYSRVNELSKGRNLPLKNGVRLTLRVKHPSWRGVTNGHSPFRKAWQILMLDQFCLKLFCYLAQFFDTKRKSIYLSLSPTSGSTCLEPGVNSPLFCSLILAYLPFWREFRIFSWVFKLYKSLIF